MTGWELLQHPQTRVKRGDTMIPQGYEIPPSKLLGRLATESLSCKSPSRRRVADNARRLGRYSLGGSEIGNKMEKNDGKYIDRRKHSIPSSRLGHRGFERTLDLLIVQPIQRHILSGYQAPIPRDHKSRLRRCRVVLGVAGVNEK